MMFIFLTSILFYCFMVLIDIDDCRSHTCRNGATCVDGVNDYTCSCVFGFTGPNCETGKLLLLYLTTYRNLDIFLLLGGGGLFEV